MILNMTGEHLIGIVIDGEIVRIPYSGYCARVNFKQRRVGAIDEVPIYINRGGVIKGLPEPEEGTVYVTSRLVAEFVRRPDVCCPNSAPGHVIRDGYGMPMAVDSLLTYAPYR